MSCCSLNEFVPHSFWISSVLAHLILGCWGSAPGFFILPWSTFPTFTKLVLLAKGSRHPPEIPPSFWTVPPLTLVSYAFFLFSHYYGENRTRLSFPFSNPSVFRFGFCLQPLVFFSSAVFTQVLFHPPPRFFFLTSTAQSIIVRELLPFFFPKYMLGVCLFQRDLFAFFVPMYPLKTPSPHIVPIFSGVLCLKISLPPFRVGFFDPIVT